MTSILIVVPLAVAALLVWLLAFPARRFWVVVGLVCGGLFAVAGTLALRDPAGVPDLESRLLGVALYFAVPFVLTAAVVRLVKRIPSRLLIGMIGVCVYVLAVYCGVALVLTGGGFTP